MARKQVVLGALSCTSYCRASSAIMRFGGAVAVGTNFDDFVQLLVHFVRRTENTAWYR